MPARAIERSRREPGRPPDSLEPPGHRADPVLALQRTAGNRAVAELLARAPADKGTTATVQIGGVGAIKVSGGNLEEWTGKGAPDTVDVTSEKGRHSGKLEKLASARTKTDVTVTIAPAQKAGGELNVGGGTVLEIKDARVAGYAVEDGAESWRLVDFENVKRTKTTRKVS